MIEAAITSKGQVTIPKKIREILHVQAGDKIGFVLTESGDVLVQPISKPAAEVFGLLARMNEEIISVEDMEKKLENSFRDRDV